MSKNLSRDLAVLIKIKENIHKIRSTLKMFNCSSQQAFIAGNDMCRDLCSFYILQINSLGAQLTKESYESISFLCGGTMIPVRNMIAHDYTRLNLPLLFSFVLTVASDFSIKEVDSRIVYCKRNKRR